MTDVKFQKLLDDLAKSNAVYKDLLAKAEDEYHARFGVYPGEIDDDYWIDTFHVGCGHMTVAKVHEQAKR